MSKDFRGAKWRMEKSLVFCMKLCFVYRPRSVQCLGREAPLVLLLFNAGPVDITFAQESPEVDAILACGYPAQATGEALYRVLTGSGPHSVPAGRLPATWPAQLNQVIANLMV